jgi:uncharacterized membrane protein YbaN (DUF454 family)
VFRVVLIVFGTVFLALGAVGVVVPGLPTTPFLLLAAALYFRSSDRLYSWLLNHKVFGRPIRNFRETRSISLRAKIISIAAMWAMILVSILLFLPNTTLRVTVAALGAVGTIVLLLIKTSKSG